MPCRHVLTSRNYLCKIFFENVLKYNYRTKIASGVVSTALQCKRFQCPTTEIDLKEPVIIQFAHSQDTIVRVEKYSIRNLVASIESLFFQSHLQQDESAKILCVFWDFQDGRNR